MIDVIGWPSSEIVGLIRGKPSRYQSHGTPAGAGAAMSRRVMSHWTRDVIQEEDAGVRSRLPLKSRVMARSMSLV